MQSVLIDDRRIHVDFSQSVSKLHKDWISKRTGNKESMGGFDNLQKRTRYRDGEGRNKRDEGYDLVFDTNKKDHKKHKTDDDKPRRSDSRRDDDRDSSKRDSDRGSSRKDSGSSRRDDRRDNRRDYDRKRDDRKDNDRPRDHRDDDRREDRDRRRDDDRRRR